MSLPDKVKIVVVGDSGVGKSSLIQLLCHGKPVSNTSWTVGCSVEVKLHEYKEGTASQKTFFIEFWDIGASEGHKSARAAFYQNINGIILVHDLTNRKSEQNLRKWLAEILSAQSGNVTTEDMDVEMIVGSAHVKVPMLVIGTKQDTAEDIRSSLSKKPSRIAEEYGADEVLLNCKNPRSLAPGSGSRVKLSRFFDKVIERRYFANDRNPLQKRLSNLVLPGI